MSNLFVVIMTSFFCFFNSFLGAYQYQLSIGMIFQNEAPYLKEWIEYHRLVGVEHFYLFNNESKDQFKKVLSPYIKKGIVELFDARILPDFNGTQVDCYNRTLIMTRGVSKWVAMIDADEFLMSPEGTRIPKILKNFDSFGGVIVNWQSFGTSNISKIPPNQLMIECLTHCAPMGHYMNAMIKSIVRPERVRHFGGPHWGEYAENWFAVDTNSTPYISGSATSSKRDKLWINHYWTRDEYFFNKIKIPRSLAWGRSEEGMRQMNKELNESTDDAILHHVPALRKKLFRDIQESQ